MLTNEQVVQYADFEALMKAAKDMHAALKDEVRAEFEARYAETGDRSRDALEGGERVATLTWVPGRAAAQLDALAVDDAEAFARWCGANGCMRPDEDAALGHMMATGEVPDGCAPVKRTSGGRSGYVKVTLTPERRAQVAERTTLLLGGEA